MLFAKLGLDFDSEVPQKIKDQLEKDKNSKQILVNLTKKFENGELQKMFIDNEEKPAAKERETQKDKRADKASRSPEVIKTTISEKKKRLITTSR